MAESGRRTPAYVLRERLPWPLWALYRVVRVTLVASAFVGFWAGGTCLAWVILPVLALLSGGSADARRRSCQRMLGRGFRLFHGYMRALRLVDARVVGTLPALDAGRGCVLVANHTTLVDVTAILSRLDDVCAMAKSTYASSVFVGNLLRVCGFVPAGESMVERGAAIDEAVRRVESGFYVLVFPEGTRSPEGSLHRFHRGAFEIACRARAPVVPLVLRCDPSALRRGMPFWRHPDTCARLSIEVGAAIHPAAFQGNSRAMRRAVEERYRSWLGLGPG